MQGIRARFREMSFSLTELSGGLGDLGLYIPLTLSLVSICGMEAGALLFFTGVVQIAGGFAFGQPFPVQPMKAIATIAIAEALSPGTIAAAGFLIGLVFLLLSALNLIGPLDRTIPRPVVRGIQLGVGLKLALKGVTVILALSWWNGYDNRLLALAAATVIISTSYLKRFPTALALLVGGFALLLCFGQRGLSWFSAITWGWSGPAVIWPSADEWVSGAIYAALPQIPLTLLNSVLATAALSADYFSDRSAKVRPIATSVGLINVTGCFLGAMPMCHGSGGLAAHLRFGARTGGSVVMLGAIMIVIALAFGNSAHHLMAFFPAGLLGTFLVFSGVELATPARRCKTAHAFTSALVTAVGIVAVNTFVGFVLGLVFSWCAPAPISSVEHEAIKSKAPEHSRFPQHQ